MIEPQDVDLLERIARQRDRSAFAILYERHELAAYNLALYITGKPETADEAMQEAMIRVWNAAASCRTSSVRSWILRIVARESLRMMKSEKRQSQRVERARLISSRNAAAAPEQRIEQEELVGQVREAVRGLSDEERQLIALQYAAGMTQEEIGEMLDIPRQTVSYRIGEILKSMRGRLAQAGLASAGPLLTNDVLTQSMCTGSTVPAGLQAKVLSTLAGKVTAAAAISGKAAAVSAGKASLAWLMLGAVAVIGAGGAIFALTHKTPPPAVTVKNTVVSPAPATPYVRKFVFDKEQPAPELKVVTGSWHFVPDGSSDGRGCMETDTDLFSFEIDEKVATLPLRVRIKSQCLPPMPKDNFIVSIGWSDFLEAYEFKNAGQLVITPPREWLAAETIIGDDFLDHYTDKTRTAIFFFKRDPDAKLRLFARGKQRIEYLEIRSITTAELPDVASYRNVIANIPAARRQGTIEIPELKSMRPPNPVTLTFHSGTGQ